MQEHRSISRGAEPATHVRLRANTTGSAVTLNFGLLNRDDGEPRHNVAGALGRKGWQVHTQIGASSFRVDLGVVHPDFAGRYLAGVERDGATYHRSATARDRDKLREQVLRGLGWEIVRIWSTDWWVNPGGTLERVHAQLTTLLGADRARRAAEAAVYAKAVAAPRLAGCAPAAEAAGRPTFQVSNPAQAVPAEAISAERFFDAGYDTVLEAMVDWVVAREGPVLDAVLARRIARAHGFLRTGSRIQERVELIARRRFQMSEEAGGTFYWPRGVTPGGEVAFRWPADEDSTRGVEEICEAELLALGRFVLKRVGNANDAVLVMARGLGIQPLREGGRLRLRTILDGVLT